MIWNLSDGDLPANKWPNKTSSCSVITSCFVIVPFIGMGFSLSLLASNVTVEQEGFITCLLEKIVNTSKVQFYVSQPLLVHEQLSVQVLMVAGVLDRVDQLLGFDELITVSFQVVGLRHDTPPWWQRKTRVTRICLDRKERKKPLYLTDSGSDGRNTWWQKYSYLCRKHSSRTFYFFKITLLSNRDTSVGLLAKAHSFWLVSMVMDGINAGIM